MKKLSQIFALILAVILFVGCQQGQPQPSVESVDEKTDFSKSQIEEAMLTEHEDSERTISSKRSFINTISFVDEFEGQKPNPMNEYVVVNVTLTGFTDEPLSISRDDYFIVHDKFETGSTPLVAWHESMIPETLSLGRDETVTYNMVFEYEKNVGMLTLLQGQRPYVYTLAVLRGTNLVPLWPYWVNGEAQSLAITEESVINEAFALSELSQHAEDDTLFLFEYYVDEENIVARDVEICDIYDDFGSSSFAVIPKYEGSIVLLEGMGLDLETGCFFVVHNTFLNSISTDNYALLIKQYFHTGLSYTRITVTYNGISVAFDLRMNGIGYLEQPYAADGYVLSLTPITPEMAQ